MRAWLMETYNGVGSLKMADVPPPQPGPGEVVIRTRFAGLNPADAFFAQKMYPANPPLPHVLGRDGAGELIAVGAGVNGFRIGDTVGILRGENGVNRWGTLAEMTVVPAENLVPLPRGWRLEELAAAPLVFLTAWQALTMWTTPGGPESGSVVLITGASGGVGVAALLLAKSMGLHVVALSRSADKRSRLKELGADFAFDPGDPDLVKTIGRAIAPKKVALAVDNIGGDLFPQIIATLGHGGRVSVVGRSGGEVPRFNTATLLFRRVRVGGVAVADYSVGDAQATWREIVARLDRLGCRPIVDRVFPFADVKAAFARLAEGPMGKVVVDCGGAGALS